MLRTRKKDINLKPNRILDKRSSRGMLYENEELRLRTIHINDEVDKGQTNIKKLKKENEQLKREIWGLRDECEKLEDMLKKLYTAIEESGNSENFGLSADARNTMFDLPSSKFRRMLRRESGMSVATDYSQSDSELEIDVEETADEAKFCSSEEYLEKIDEQPLDSVSKSTKISSGGLQVPLHYGSIPHLAQGSEDCPNTNTETTPEDENIDECPHILRPAFNDFPTMTPIIEITPANSTMTVPDEKGSAKNLHDVGQPLIPENYRVTAEAFVESHSLATEQDQSFSKVQGANLSYLSRRRNSLTEKSRSADQETEYSLVSRSEPTLCSSDLDHITQANVPAAITEVDDMTTCDVSGYDPHVLVGHVETGNGVTGKVTTKVTDFRIEEVIDELENQLGQDLSNVIGVRLMNTTGPITVFISFRTPESFISLVDRGLLELRDGHIRMRLIEAEKKCSLVRLSYIPSQIPDALVIQVLNQWGQVVAPLVRKSYKGVDVSERLAKMYVCAKLPQVIYIGGYEIPAKICIQVQKTITVTSIPEIIAREITEEHTSNEMPDSPTAQALSSSVSHPVRRTITRTISSAPRLQSDSELRLYNSLTMRLTHVFRKLKF